MTIKTGIKDVTIVVADVTEGDEGYVYAYTKVVKCDLEGDIQDFLDYVGQYKGIIEMSNL